jgi:hypothetical protein
MLPISSVAFKPGRLVHTNEFRLSSCDDKFCASDTVDHSSSLLSYWEVHQVLQERLTSVEGKLNSLKTDSASFKAPEQNEDSSQDQGLPFYEIREYADDTGKVYRHEVVDVQGEVRGIVHKARLLQKHKSNNESDSIDIESLEALEKSFEKLTAVDNGNEDVSTTDATLLSLTHSLILPRPLTHSFALHAYSFTHLTLYHLFSHFAYYILHILSFSF